MVHEPYTEQVPHQEMESYNCGTGGSYRTCTRSVTRYRSETKYRWVNRVVEVPDGDCASSLTFAPAVGHVYLLEYTYRDHRACALSCFEQSPMPDGTFRNQLCPVAAAPQ